MTEVKEGQKAHVASYTVPHHAYSLRTGLLAMDDVLGVWASYFGRPQSERLRLMSCDVEPIFVVTNEDNIVSVLEEDGGQRVVSRVQLDRGEYSENELVSPGDRELAPHILRRVAGVVNDSYKSGVELTLLEANLKPIVILRFVKAQASADAKFGKTIEVIEPVHPQPQESQPQPWGRRRTSVQFSFDKRRIEHGIGPTFP